MILNLAEWKREQAPVITYSGNHTTQDISVDGVQYTLYSFTDSGTLTITGGKLKNADIWACGGGATPIHSRGGGGGYTAQINGQTLADGQYVITIGAAQSATSISHNGTALLTANGAHAASHASDLQRGYGGSGGGEGAGGSYGGTGQGTSTRPFGDSVNFTSLPCAGGGGSANIHGDEVYTGRGGKGGSNGSNGLAGTSSWDSTTIPTWGGDGGETGGGKGQSMDYNGATAASGTSATYYGSGGGGGYYRNQRGYGYQGWLLIRVPA